jgi:hypothetical protein
MAEEFNSMVPRLEPKIIIPARILRILEEMTKIAGDLEYALYLSAVVDTSDYSVWVRAGDGSGEKDFIVPKQKISGALVEPEFCTEGITDDEGKPLDPIDREWNVIVHRHPEGVFGFSPVDEQYLNQNNGISFLYLKGYRVCDAMANFVAGDFLYDSRKLSAYTQDPDGKLVPLNCKFDYRGHKTLRTRTAPGVAEICDAIDISDVNIFDYKEQLVPSAFNNALAEGEQKIADAYAARNGINRGIDLRTIAEDSKFGRATDFLK